MNRNCCIESQKYALRVDYDGSLRLEFYGLTITSDHSFFPHIQPQELLPSGGAAKGRALMDHDNPLRKKLIKIGAKAVCYARYVIFQMGDVAMWRYSVDRSKTALGIRIFPMLARIAGHPGNSGFVIK